MAEDVEEIPVGDMPPWVNEDVEEAVDVANAGIAGDIVKQTINSSVPQENIINSGSSASDAAFAAAAAAGQPLEELNGVTNGTNINFTSAASSSSLDIKTNRSQ